MKKFIGITLLIIGVLAAVFAIFQIVNYSICINALLPFSSSGEYDDGIEIMKLHRLLFYGLAGTSIASIIVGVLLVKSAKRNKVKKQKELESQLLVKLTNDINSSANDLSETKISQLEKLAKLKEQGILSEEEFIMQKKKILQ